MCNSISNKKAVYGSPAHPGRVIGRVVVIEKIEDFLTKELKAENNILVTHSTFPDTVPYLKKFQAIVTEEGGILSHAAVISREMKIPCVIGTKIATKVFKDDDTVEVDAKNGIVKRIQ